MSLLYIFIWRLNMDKYTKRTTDGSVDIDASSEAYAAALTEWVVTNEIPSEKIETAVNAVLEASPSGRVPMPALLSLASQEMNATPETFTVLSDRIHAYVQGQAKAGLLFVTKGKGGGCSRTAPEPKKAKSDKSA
jgi:hypothetical protein